MPWEAGRRPGRRLDLELRTGPVFDMVGPADLEGRRWPQVTPLGAGQDAGVVNYCVGTTEGGGWSGYGVAELATDPVGNG